MHTPGVLRDLRYGSYIYDDLVRFHARFTITYPSALASSAEAPWPVTYTFALMSDVWTMIGNLSLGQLERDSDEITKAISK